MKRELFSAIIGGGIVGAIWIGTAWAHQSGCSLQEKMSQPIDYPNRLTEPVKDVYSTVPEKNFPGIKLFNTDFLVPINRMHMTQYVVADNPDENYGSGNMPMTAFLFIIDDADASHYFLASGPQYSSLNQLVYLGKNVTIEKVEPAGNGYYMATCSDDKGRAGYGYVEISGMTGSEPVKDTGIAQKINLNPLTKFRSRCDEFVYEVKAEQLWKLFQKAVRENDKERVASMLEYPIGTSSCQIYTRAEFVEHYDEIIDETSKKNILEGDASNIMYSWRGALLPNGSWIRDAYEKNVHAGPITL